MTNLVCNEKLGINYASAEAQFGTKISTSVRIWLKFQIITDLSKLVRIWLKFHRFWVVLKGGEWC